MFFGQSKGSIEKNLFGPEIISNALTRGAVSIFKFDIFLTNSFEKERKRKKKKIERKKKERKRERVLL